MFGVEFLIVVLVLGYLFYRNHKIKVEAEAAKLRAEADHLEASTEALTGEADRTAKLFAQRFEQAAKNAESRVAQSVGNVVKMVEDAGANVVREVGNEAKKL